MRKKIFSFFIYWLPPLIWAVIIFKLSSKPILIGSDVYWKDFTFKKSAHVFFYGTFAILIFRAMKASGFSKLKAVYWAVIIAFLYGISDEIHQSFIRGREPTLRDVLIDTTAASLAMLVLYKYVQFFPKKVQTFLKKLDLI